MNQTPSFFRRIFQRTNSPVIVNIMNSNIALSRALLERLVIVDDSIVTYNAYKSKFYLILIMN